MSASLFDLSRDGSEWDALVQRSNNGTFLHSRKFLSYHGERFVDRSLVFREDDHVVAVLPAARDPFDPACVISHPGITYGGIVHADRICVEKFREWLDDAIAWYLADGAAELVYKCIPIHLHSRPSQLDQYVLWHRGARLHRRDLWNVIELGTSRKLSKGRKWSVNKGLKSGISVGEENGDKAYEEFDMVLRTCLETRHRLQPVHTLPEMLILRDLFPDQIRLWLAHDANGQCVAGAWMFKIGKRAWHTQYIASTENGRQLCAVDLLVETVIKTAEQEGANYFSFGASTEQDGTILNAGLFDFKSGFGFGSVVHDFYRLDCA